MRRDDSGEFWWDMLVGAGIGVVSQLASDMVTSVIEGELTFSSTSSYIGAAVGGALGALTPGGAVLGDVVGTAVTTIVGMVGNNIENTIAGNNQIYTFEEMFYTTTINVMLAGVNGVAFRDSKLVKQSKIFDANILWSNHKVVDVLSGAFPTIVDGFLSSSPFTKLSAASHRWERYR